MTKSLPDSEDLPLDRDAKILDHHPSGLIAIDKPVGVLTHPNRKNDKKARTLLRADYDFAEERYVWMDDIGVERSLHLVHRLDSPTSGVLLATFSAELAVSLRKSFAERETHKTYYAIVREKGKAKDGHWKDRLEEVREGGNLRVKTGRGQEALAKVTFERRRVGRLGLSLVRLEPVTGRTHQLRVQASTRGFPIVGDRIYGDFALNRKIARASRVERLCLHAISIELDFKYQGTSTKFYAESPLPRILGKLLS